MRDLTWESSFHTRPPMLETSAASFRGNLGVPEISSSFFGKISGTLNSSVGACSWVPARLDFFPPFSGTLPPSRFTPSLTVCQPFSPEAFLSSFGRPFQSYLPVPDLLGLTWMLPGSLPRYHEKMQKAMAQSLDHGIVYSHMLRKRANVGRMFHVSPTAKLCFGVFGAD